MTDKVPAWVYMDTPPEPWEEDDCGCLIGADHTCRPDRARLAALLLVLAALVAVVVVRRG